MAQDKAIWIEDGPGSSGLTRAVLARSRAARDAVCTFKLRPTGGPAFLAMVRPHKRFARIDGIDHPDDMGYVDIRGVLLDSKRKAEQGTFIARYNFKTRSGQLTSL